MIVRDCRVSFTLVEPGVAHVAQRLVPEGKAEDERVQRVLRQRREVDLAFRVPAGKKAGAVNGRDVLGMLEELLEHCFVDAVVDAVALEQDRGAGFQLGRRDARVDELVVVDGARIREEEGVALGRCAVCAPTAGGEDDAILLACRFVRVDTEGGHVRVCVRV